MAKNEALEATLSVLRDEGFTPCIILYGKHLKVKCNGLPPIAVSRSASDVNAVRQARRTVRKIIAQNPR